MTKIRITSLDMDSDFGQQGLIYMIVYPSFNRGETSTVIMSSVVNYPDLHSCENQKNGNLVSEFWMYQKLNLSPGECQDFSVFLKNIFMLLASFSH